MLKWDVIVHFRNGLRLSGGRGHEVMLVGWGIFGQ